MTKPAFLIFPALLFAAAAHAETDNALDVPESAYWDPVSETWFVSSIGGSPSAPDQRGWVSRYAPDGKLIKARWAEGMDAPKGLASVNAALYVADLKAVHVIDIPSARKTATIPLPDPKFTNDVAAAPNGDVYVSDTVGGKIYKITGNQAEVWLKSEKLQSPNGLWIDGEDLVVAAWGPIIDPSTFASAHPGTLLRVNLRSKEIRPVGAGKPIGNLDGLVVVGSEYLVTDWTGGRLMRINSSGDVKTILTGFSQLADLGYDPTSDTIALPVMSDSRLIFLFQGNQ